MVIYRFALFWKNSNLPRVFTFSLCFLAIKRKRLGLGEGIFSRGSSTGEKGELLVETKRGKILWIETPKGKSLLGRSVLGLEEEEEEEEEEGGDFEKRNGFHLSSSPIFFLFLIFMVIFSSSMS